MRNPATFADDAHARHQLAAVRLVDEQIDVRGSALWALVGLCIGTGGHLDDQARGRFADIVPAAAFDVIERAVQATSASS